ncbi:carbonic anhydrase [Okeania sp.]|uniref:carbonic anhydrase n=1 Tax=Okeania sp. TaxID=3100323 RepID=UPI002B4B0606|nr:carbonic anhydrase [Okeania sp.]MEB3339506.1 carbonic anhydrase [Okeania sp.]
MNTNSENFNSKISRRKILNYGKFALAAGATSLAVSCQTKNIEQAKATPTTLAKIEVSPEMSPDEILEVLMAGNQRFVQNKLTNPNVSMARVTEVADGQNPFVTILSCADSRVPVEILFDRGFGDLFVVREAGNIATPEEIGSIEYGTFVLGSKVLMVLGHENCGAVQAAMAEKPLPGQIGSIVAAIKPAVEAAKNQPGNPVENAVKANVVAQMKIINSSPLISQLVKENKLKVVGGYYDLDEGKVSLIS